MVSRPRPSRSRTQEVAVGPHRVLQLFLTLVAHPTRAPIEVLPSEVGRHATCRESNRLERRRGPADRELQSDVAPVADNGGLCFWVGCPDPR